MAKYKVRWNYEARDWHGNLVRLRQGEEVELDESVAMWVMADSPGVLHEMGKPAQQRLIEEPGEDRMIKQAKTR